MPADWGYIHVLEGITDFQGGGGLFVDVYNIQVTFMTIITNQFINQNKSNLFEQVVKPFMIPFQTV